MNYGVNDENQIDPMFYIPFFSHFNFCSSFFERGQEGGICLFFFFFSLISFSCIVSRFLHHISFDNLWSIYVTRLLLLISSNVREAYHCIARPLLHGAQDRYISQGEKRRSENMQRRRRPFLGGQKDSRNMAFGFWVFRPFLCWLNSDVSGDSSKKDFMILPSILKWYSLQRFWQHWIIYKRQSFLAY